MPEERRQEIIVAAADAATRAHVRALLEGDGYRVSEAPTAERLRDVVRASRAVAALVPPTEGQALHDAAAEAARGRPDLDVLDTVGLGRALVEGAQGRARVALLARDALYLLATVLERSGGGAPLLDKIVPMAELTAHRLKLSPQKVEVVGAASVLACLGPLLAKAFGGTPAQPGAVAAGISRELAVAIEAAETLRAPQPLAPVLRAVEERWDGGGRPSGLAAGAIPIAARVIAVARDYHRALAEKADETAAMQRIQERSGKQYDPAVVDAFFRVLRDTRYVQRLEAAPAGPRIAVVDGDAAALAMAELRLSAAGFQVTSYNDGRTAQDSIPGAAPAAIVSEIVLPRVDGLSLLLKLRRTPGFEKIPFYLASATTDKMTLAKALKLGATDVIAKPISFDILAAKLKAAASNTGTLQASKSGVHGNLAELSLVDVIQVIAFGRRTATIHLESAAGKGAIHIERGEPHAAIFAAAQGRDAFCELAKWRDGTFSIDGSPTTLEKNLDGTIEALLLEAMRRQDESASKKA